MPLIPGVNQREVAPAAANTPYFNIDTTAEEFGSGIGKSLLAVGTALGKGADVAAKFKADQDAAEKQAKEDHQKALVGGSILPASSGAVDSSNEFYAEGQDLQSAYFNLTGKDAVTALPQMMQQIDALQQQALSHASSPDAAKLAQPAISIWSTMLKNSLQRHAAGQQQVYDDDLDDMHVDLSREAAARLYNDDENFFTNLHVAVVTRQEQSLRHLQAGGIAPTPEAANAAMTTAGAATVSDFMRARIEAALDQHDVAAAQTLNSRWAGDLLPSDRDVITRQLSAVMFSQHLRGMTQQMMGKQMGPVSNINRVAANPSNR